MGLKVCGMFVVNFVISVRKRVAMLNKNRFICKANERNSFFFCSYFQYVIHQFTYNTITEMKEIGINMCSGKVSHIFSEVA